MIRLIFLILIHFSSLTFANDTLKGYQALEEKDYKKALYYLSYDANLGDEKAQYNLGIMYKKGLGVKVNNNEAFRWFFLSANQGNILANYALGHSYLKGSGIKQNYKLAFKAFKFSALREHPSSRLVLGNMYYQGQGVSINYSKAFLWWSLAEDININGARQNIDMVKKKMSKDEYIRGKEMYSMCMQDTLYNCSKKLDLF